MPFGLRLCAVVSLVVPVTCAAPIVTSVTTPGSTLSVNLSTQVGQPFDAATVRKDVRYLWSLGRFDDVRVEQSEQPEGVSLTFRLVPRPNLFLREIRMEPHTFGLNLKVPVHSPIDPARAREIAAGAESQLGAHGYFNARVTETLLPAGKGLADLRLRIDPGDQLRIKELRFDGDPTARRDVRALRSRRILPWWRLLPPYSTEAIDSDIAHLRSNYLAKGFLDADVRPGEVEIHGKDVRLTIVARPGPQSPMPPRLCSTLLAERREAQQHGVLDFTARYDAEHGLSTEWGKPYRVGRIDFLGSHHYGDATLRRNFLLDEGDLFDELRLRRSVARLNRTGLFDNIDEKSVIVQPDEKTGYANITVRIAERKRSAWNISGPVGPMSLAGPLQAAISTRLPVWSTYMVSVGIFAFARPLIPILNAPKRFTPIFYLQRPYIAGAGWRSGFAIAPQLGWKNGIVGYASTQMQGRFLPRLTGEGSAQTVLPVTVTRPSGEAVIACEPPGPRLRLLRAGAGMALHLLGSVVQ
jgi:hypothetical protein